MKPQSVCLLLGVLALLLVGLMTVAVCYYIPPFPPIRALVHLLIIIPYFCCTWKMLSVVLKMEPGIKPADSMEMDQFVVRFPGFDEDDVTTEHQF